MNHYSSVRVFHRDEDTNSSDDRINQLKDSSYSKVLVISEDWCGDAMMNLPILKRISESLQLEVRVFHRDEDTNLIDQFNKWYSTLDSNLYLYE